MKRIVEYTMTDGRKYIWAVKTRDDENKLEQTLQNEWGFVKHDTIAGYEGASTLWLNKAHIVSAEIRDKELWEDV